MNNQGELKKAYVKLASLKKHLPSGRVEEKYADMFNAELDRLIQLGFDVEEFKILESQKERIIDGGNYATGETHYSKERYVSREILLINLDSVLSYFSIVTPETKIGFELN
ncbi:hypothetical protein HN748_02670 [Candidatus Peregrinibacteria bacterium]|jgi:hypothetical protein|nr:hypothetical protein [Candidatus Peregrinibacteria bacterium]MBT7484296.1 hypothetical protein [Candidatus Peregrinibacteria bacterium]MBT7703112.1 hypothetical protein [Candidatus Peregrinibacteria bacterium]